MKRFAQLVAICLLCVSCDGDSETSNSDGENALDAGPSGDVDTPSPACATASTGGSATVAKPELLTSFSDRWHEAWLASPVVADLDGDGTMEIIGPRSGLLLVWHANGDEVFRIEVDGRIWTSPVVADMVAASPGLEIAAAVREKIYLWNAQGESMSGFPVSWHDELRSLAAGDIDGDGALELVAVSTNRLESGGQRDIIIAYNTNGTVVDGFPPNTTGSSECDDRCHVTGGYDQNIALGDVNGDGVDDIFATQDNAYLSLHRGSGLAFDSADVFEYPTKFLGVRFLHDYDLAKQGWANDEDTADQAHFTNSAPAIADLDGDGQNDLIVLGSVQNAAQTDRFRGVGLWALHNDGSRLSNWTEPFHASDYLAGLWDYDGTNVVGATNQVSVADIFPDRAGPELVFAGFDGRIHCVDARREEVWQYTYTTDDRVLTGGVLVVDLSGDGIPEVVFNTYSPDDGKSVLVVLSSTGQELHSISLPGRGAMAVPTVADIDGNGTVEIVINLKGGEDKEPLVLVYEVPGSSDNCLLWPTGRANYLRNGYMP